LTEHGCERTHRTIDYPVKFFGKGHRILFHDPLSASFIGFLTDGEKGVYAGLSHILLDYCCSKVPVLKYLLKLVL
jgi:hypothetical protein